MSFNWFSKGYADVMSASNASAKGYTTKVAPFSYQGYSVNNVPINVNNNPALSSNSTGYTKEFAGTSEYTSTLYNTPLALALGNIKYNYTNSLQIIKTIVSLVNDSDKKNNYFENVKKDLTAKQTQLKQNGLSQTTINKFNNELNTMKVILYNTSKQIIDNYRKIAENVVQLKEFTATQNKNSETLRKLININIKSKANDFNKFFEDMLNPVTMAQQPMVPMTPPMAQQPIVQESMYPPMPPSVPQQLGGTKGKSKKTKKSKK